MRKVHETVDTLLDTHAELARTKNQPEVVEMINNLRQDIHLLVDDAIKAARGQDSNLEV